MFKYSTEEPLFAETRFPVAVELFMKSSYLLAYIL